MQQLCYRPNFLNLLKDELTYVFDEMIDERKREIAVLELKKRKAISTLDKSLSDDSED